MKFIRTLIASLFLALISWTQLSAQPVDRQDALILAESFIDAYFADYPRKVEELTLYGTDEMPLIYIVNLSPEGWILVSGNKGASPVIGFSYEDEFIFPEANTDNPAYNWLMQSSGQLMELYEYPADRENITWSEGFEGDVSKSAKSVSPLISTRWGQGTGWNQFCPVDANGPDGKALVGCVAVAMAQAITAFELPVTGTGASSYDHDIYGTIYNDYSESVYEWDLMSDTEANEHSALLLYDCATAVEMRFGPTSSSASTYKAPASFTNHFSMANNSAYLSKIDYAADTWVDMLINELENDRPVIYRGRHADGGHAFVICGVVSSKYFFINWGWEGRSNGSFLIDNLNPGTRTYNENQAGIFFLQPASWVVGIDDNFADLFTVYPNPSSDYINFSSSFTDKLESIKVFSINGLLTKVIQKVSSAGSIDISGLNPGIYILEFTMEDNTVVRRKIIKE